MCSPSVLPKVRTLLSAVSAADSYKHGGRADERDNSGAVVSCLRGQRLSRFILEAVHVMLPLLRHPIGATPTAARAGFIDIAAILLHFTLRGHQVHYPAIALRPSPSDTEKAGCRAFFARESGRFCCCIHVMAV